MNFKENKLLEQIDECNGHIKRMIRAYKKMTPFMPLNISSYDQLTEDQIEHIDQFLFRFSKLQDAMGEKIFKTVIDCTGEGIKKMTYIDILNRLEELDILKTLEWQGLRELRNITAHEYPTMKTEIIENLNLLYEKSVLMHSIFLKIKGFIFNKVLSVAPKDLPKYNTESF